MPFTEALQQLVAFAQNLPTWAWVALIIMVLVGGIWLVVDVVSFLVVAILITVATIVALNFGYSYVEAAWQYLRARMPQAVEEAGHDINTAAQKSLNQAPIVPPIKPQPGTNP